MAGQISLRALVAGNAFVCIMSVGQHRGMGMISFTVHDTDYNAKTMQ